jgi:hypothetical protein
MQRKDVNAVRTLSCRCLVTMQRHAFESATTLSSEPRSRVIDEYPPHQARSHAKEVGPVAPVNLSLID